MSDTRTPEPTTETDAQALQRFLKSGATTVLDQVHSFAAKAPVGGSLGRPAVVSFGVTGKQVLAVVAEGDNRRAILALGISDVARNDEFFVQAFVNDPNASAETPATDPHFVGALAFFCQTQDADGRFVCIRAEDTVVFNLDLVPSLHRIDNGSDPLTATLVLVPFGSQPPQNGTLAVRTADVTVYASEVKLES